VSSVEPRGVELGLVLDAGVHLEHLPDRHGSVGGRREAELHAQGAVLALCWGAGRKIDKLIHN